MKNKRYIAAALTIVVVLAAAAGVLWYETGKEKAGIVCYINEEPVYEGEIKILAERIEMAQRQEFAEKSGQSADELDFSFEVDGKTGYEYYAEAVLEEMKRIKVIQIDARKNGLCEEITYPDIEKAREEENQKRAEKKSRNDVVYGVVSYDEEEYYDYFNENLSLANKRYLEQKGILTATETEKKADYEAEKDYFDNQPYESVEQFVGNRVISLKYEKRIQNLMKKATVEKEHRVADYLEKVIK